MRHIKTWHSLNALFEGFSTDDYYIVIPSEEGREYINQPVKWDAGKMMDKLSLLLKDNFIKKSENYYGSNNREDKSNFISKSVIHGEVSVVVHYHSNKYFQDFSIIPLEDEYYLVIHEEWYYNYNYKDCVVYYKCDQWDGLVKLIKDKLYII